MLVIVDGNLYVDGAMTVASCEDDDSYMTVHMAGSLSAQSVALSMDPWLKIAGDVEVEDLISCGSGRAYIDIFGSLSCRLAIAAAPGCITVKKGFTGMAIGDKETFSGVKKLEPEETAYEVLLPRFVEKDTSAIMPDKVWRSLRNGTTVTRG